MQLYTTFFLWQTLPFPMHSLITDTTTHDPSSSFPYNIPQLLHNFNVTPCKNMAFVSLVLAAILVFSSAYNGGMGSDTGGGGDAVVMEEDELFGLFEVMGSLLDDPTWAEAHPLPCTDTPWPGVECELLEETSVFHVTKIHIGEDVVVPPCKNSAKLSFSLLKLPYLKTLSLINCFTKSPVSLSKPLFKSLSSLEHLSLVSNPALFGQIPSTISNLSSLKTLSLSQNNLSGEIPEEIGGLISLQQLDLSHNNLSGVIPAEIGRLEKLNILDLSWNLLEQTLPSSVNGLGLLEKMDLSSNKLEGKLPLELGQLENLILLDLSRNIFSGPIPNLSSLQQLQYLIMEGNPLNSTIPSFIGSLTKLSVLSFSGCGLTGPIPITLSNLTNLTALSMDNNSLQGTVPTELGTLQNLNTLNLRGNRLTGELLFRREFIDRLGQRLDIRENNGLCTNPGNITNSRLLQNPTCAASTIYSGSANKTLAENNPDKNLKPKMSDGNTSSNLNSHGLFQIVFLFLLFGSI